MVNQNYNHMVEKNVQITSRYMHIILILSGKVLLVHEWC